MFNPPYMFNTAWEKARRETLFSRTSYLSRDYGKKNRFRIGNVGTPYCSFGQSKFKFFLLKNHNFFSHRTVLRIKGHMQKMSV